MIKGLNNGGQLSCKLNDERWTWEKINLKKSIEKNSSQPR
jgi:hypothetical protein